MDGQRVLVTAGASGIGWAVVQAFVASGARVHVADVDADAVAAVTASSGPVTGTVCDVSDPDGVERLFRDLTEALGGLDVLVNTPGSPVRPRRSRTTPGRAGMPSSRST